jgi:Zn-dependent M32 family carboxypeptidase
MAEKIVEQKITEVALKPEVAELLNELRTNVKVLDPKKANVRLIKRTLATIKAVISDLEAEIV